VRPLAFFVAISSAAAVISRPMEWTFALTLLAGFTLSVLYLAEGQTGRKAGEPKDRS